MENEQSARKPFSAFPGRLTAGRRSLTPLMMVRIHPGERMDTDIFNMVRKQQAIWQDVDKVLSALAESKSTADLLTRLSLPLNTTSYRNAREFARVHNVVLPLFSSKERSDIAKRQRNLRVPLSEMFREHSPYDRGTVKKRALKEGLLEYKCYGSICKANGDATETWTGLVLQLEHKNGVGDDNRIENLELLCPNCHSLTETYGAGNRIRYENGSHGCCEKCGRKSRTKHCARCAPAKQNLNGVSLESLANSISERGVAEVAKQFNITQAALLRALRKRQSKIASIIGTAGPDYKGKIQYPDTTKLVELVKQDGYAKTARGIGVSDNALRKHLLKRLGKLPDSFHSHTKKI